MNAVFLIGNLTKDPEHRVTTSGTPVCTFSLAVNRRTSQDGEKKTDFISIVTWKGLADICSKYLKKGSRVAVGGTLQTRTYEKDGVKRYVSEVVANEVDFLNKVTSDAESNPFADLAPTEDECPF